MKETDETETRQSRGEKVGQRNSVTFCFCFQFACRKGNGKGSSEDSELYRQGGRGCSREEQCLWFLDVPSACCDWLDKHQNPHVGHWGVRGHRMAGLGPSDSHMQSCSLGDALSLSLGLEPRIPKSKHHPFSLPLSWPHTCPIPICFFLFFSSFIT